MSESAGDRCLREEVVKARSSVGVGVVDLEHGRSVLASILKKWPSEQSRAAMAMLPACQARLNEAVWAIELEREGAPVSRYTRPLIGSIGKAKWARGTGWPLGLGLQLQGSILSTGEEVGAGD